MFFTLVTGVTFLNITSEELSQQRKLYVTIMVVRYQYCFFCRLFITNTYFVRIMSFFWSRVLCCVTFSSPEIFEIKTSKVATTFEVYLRELLGQEWCAQPKVRFHITAFPAIVQKAHDFLLACAQISNFVIVRTR